MAYLLFFSGTKENYYCIRIGLYFSEYLGDKNP